MASYRAMLKEVLLPKMVRVKQVFDRPRIENIPLAVRTECERKEIAETIEEGMDVAITAGSRGISNIAAILKEIVAFCRKKGAKPFLVPAMGSHGGATAEGQKAVLAGYGVTEDYCGCPIRSSMEVKQVGVSSAGEPVRIDQFAADADAIIAVNRIKAHTAFRGSYESGLMKMLTIGLGKHEGAQYCHKTGFRRMHELVPQFGKTVIENANVAFGLAIIENAYGETSRVQALLPQEIIEKEPELLAQSKVQMGKILFSCIDVLIVDEIGKDISGEGADPNVSGAFPTQYAGGGMECQRRVCLRISQKSHGCAYGIGLFDVTTRKLFEMVDWESTYVNAVTNTLLDVVKLPAVMPSDREAIALAIRTCYDLEERPLRMVRIKNTACLNDIYISEGMLEEADGNPAIRRMGDPAPFVFDEEGTLLGL